MTQKVIFDIGMHYGRDTGFYLAKGFRVIAVEAAPAHVAAARTRFESPVASGQLEIVDRAICDGSTSTIDFFINPTKDDWGSIYQGAAEKGMNNATKITAETTTLAELVARYGIPYYLKCDIEGGDLIVLNQLTQLQEFPEYASFEVNEPVYFDLLQQRGYVSGQLVNQCINWSVKPPNPAREGSFVEAGFDGHCSGLFGLELPPEKWEPLSALKQRYCDWLKVSTADPMLVGYAWLDVHARRY